MTITLDIDPEVQAELERRASAQGIQLEEYAASLLQQAVQTPAHRRPPDQEAIENTIREMAQFSHKIPSLPDSAFSRECLYQDHD